MAPFSPIHRLYFPQSQPLLVEQSSLPFTWSSQTQDPPFCSLLKSQPNIPCHIIRCSSFRHVLSLLRFFKTCQITMAFLTTLGTFQCGDKPSCDDTTPGYFPPANHPIFCPETEHTSQSIAHGWTKAEDGLKVVGKFYHSYFSFPIKIAFINARYDWI